MGTRQGTQSEHRELVELEVPYSEGFNKSEKLEYYSIKNEIDTENGHVQPEGSTGYPFMVQRVV